MPPKSKSLSTTREMAIASSAIHKRPREDTLSVTPSDNDQDSDFEASKHKSSKARPKKQKTTIPALAPATGALHKVPRAWQSDDGNDVYGSAKWVKEVTMRDEWWTDFMKKLPKGVFAKRFGVQCVTDLNAQVDAQEEAKAARKVARERKMSAAQDTGELGKGNVEVVEMVDGEDAGDMLVGNDGHGAGHAVEEDARQGAGTFPSPAATTNDGTVEGTGVLPMVDGDAKIEGAGNGGTVEEATLNGAGVLPEGSAKKVWEPKNF